MNYRTFQNLISAAEDVAEKEEFITAELWRLSGKKKEACLSAIWDYAHDRSLKHIRMMTGLSRTAFASEYQIPYRTVTDWERDQRVPPPYVLDLLAFSVITSAKFGKN